MSNEYGRTDRLYEFAAELDSERTLLHAEQERWAEWRAAQEIALDEYLEELVAREQALEEREAMVAQALKDLEAEAMMLDQRYKLSSASTKESTRRGKPHRTSRPTQTDYNSEEEDEEFSSSSEEPENIEPPPARMERARPSSRQRSENAQTTRKDRNPGLEVRVDSPDNTRVHVTYREPPPTIQENSESQRATPAVDIRRPLGRLNAAPSLPQPPPLDQERLERVVQSKIRTLRSYPEVSEAEEHPAPPRITEIVRNAMPQVTGDEQRTNSRSSVATDKSLSLEYRLRNLADKLA